MPQDSLVRRRVIYSGRVQGVGFRWTTSSIASRFAVDGYVKNLPGGTVELVVQGTASTVREFLEAVAERFRSNIRNAEEFPLAAEDDLTGFSIRH